MADEDVFRALADPTRRLILDELSERDGQTLFELCGRLLAGHGIQSSRQAITQHLDTLQAAGLVTSRREGRYRFLHLSLTPLQQAVGRWLGPRPDTTPATPQPSTEETPCASP